MNFLLPFTINTLWSFKKELFYISLTFLMVLLLPVIATIALTHSGVEEVSDTLVQYNARTNTVKLFYPSGELYKEVTLDIAWPVAGIVTQEFGEPELPFYLFHNGIDIANPQGRIGDPVTPIMAGKVIYADETFWGLGKHVIVDHGDNITTVYGHLDRIYVEKDQEVVSGTVIGLEGNTGWSTGPHLHLEVRVFGIPVNPRVFLGS